MSNIRFKILKKISQTTQTVIPAPPAVPPILFAHIREGYNGNTAQLIINLTEQLHTALHYSSNGDASFQDIIDNNLDLSGAGPDEKNIGGLSKIVYSTFLNSKNPFTGKVAPKTIETWATNIISSQQYNNLSQINPTGTLAVKLQGNLKSTILDLMNQIKQQNPLK